ncbi:MAG: hypothetical protein K8T10_22010 [Candidatus Eremiobacteraeota bacterium]|nr:hypothetical protein [Candidatus Eremiobacteraeota bacterium]
MARQRMYLLERAYVDYWERIRNFVRRLLEICGDVWSWFWDGRGSDIIEVILRICVVLSGIVSGVAYVLYERSHGRGFSFGMLFVFIIIAVYVWVLMSAWKAPIHFIARLVSGISAAAVVLLLSIAAIAIALVVFSVYLFVLFVLTVLSFLVFIPMRVGQEIWLLSRHITYECPHDDCQECGLPIHVCSCGQQYDDLLPSFYGIFHHICRHSDGDVKLPTMDFLGRNKLIRRCRNCKRELIHSSLGDLPPWSIVVIGGTSTGKTVYLRQTVRQMLKRPGPLRGGKVCIDSNKQKSEIENDLEKLDKGQVVEKTAGGVREALGVAVRLPKKGYLLQLYDEPGEFYAKMEQFGRMQALQKVKGIILIIDPFSLSMLSRHADQLGPRLKPSQDLLSDIISNTINNIRIMCGTGGDGKFGIPIAVVLNKADAFPTQDFPFLAKLYRVNGSPGGKELSENCRSALNNLGEGNSIRSLEQNFSKIRYFACTSLGRIPDLRKTEPFKAAGVVEPLLWLMGLDYK